MLQGALVIRYFRAQSTSPKALPWAAGFNKKKEPEDTLWTGSLRNLAHSAFFGIIAGDVGSPYASLQSNSPIVRAPGILGMEDRRGVVTVCSLSASGLCAFLANLAWARAL